MDARERLEELQARLHSDHTDGYGPLLLFSGLPEDRIAVRYREAEDHPRRCASFSDFAALLSRPEMGRTWVALRDTRLTHQEFARLAELRPGASLLRIHNERSYVR